MRYSYAKHKGSDVKLTDFYWYEQAFTPEECNKIVQVGDSIEALPATILGTDGDAPPEYRKSKVAWIPQVQEWDWVYHRLLDYAWHANNEIWHFDLDGVGENIQYTTYKEGGDHYDWHMDLGDAFFSRKVSLVVQLTDEDAYTGGDLEMKFGAWTSKVGRKQGSLTVFPSYVLHKVNPVVKGTRNSLVLWMWGPPFK